MKYGIYSNIRTDIYIFAKSSIVIGLGEYVQSMSISETVRVKIHSYNEDSEMKKFRITARIVGTERTIRQMRYLGL